MIRPRESKLIKAIRSESTPLLGKLPAETTTKMDDLLRWVPTSCKWKMDRLPSFLETMDPTFKLGPEGRRV